MKGILLDTDVVSYLLKDSPIAQPYRPHLEGRTPVISFITVAELYRWALQRSWGQKRRDWLEASLKKFVVLPFDNQLCMLWARIVVERRNQPIPYSDAWIAASAVNHGLPLVTNNARHFAGISGLQVISEWKEREPT